MVFKCLLECLQTHMVHFIILFVRLVGVGGFHSLSNERHEAIDIHSVEGE
jgi:hypothetical protein